VRRNEVYDEPRAKRVVAVTTARRAVRSGLIWGLVSGLSVAAIATGYASAYPTAASRAKLASAFAGNVGFAALYGQAHHLDTVAGFTAWRTGGVVWIIAIWALFLGTRTLRGEEEAGRWELFLAGRTTRRGATVQALTGLASGVGALWALAAIVAVAAGSSSKVGFSTSASLYFATSLVAGAAMFLAVGVLAGELAATRRQANLIGGAVLGASMLIRMVADAGVGVAWLRWASPFGWIEELRPLTGSRPLAFLPIAALVAACGVATVRLAAGRDLGASSMPSRDAPRPRLALLGDQAGLTVRLTRPVALAWIGGLGLLGLLFGVVATSSARALKGTKGVEEAIRRLGGVRGGVASFLGIEFVFVAAFLAFAAAGQIAAARNQEAAGYLDHLFSRPVARWRWLLGRLGAAAAMLVLGGLCIGVVAWAGAATQHSGVGLGDLVQAGLNVVPAALFVLGVGTLVYGLRPRVAAAAAYGVIGWSFLVEIVGSAMKANRWLLDTSLLTHISPAPAADPDWTAAAWLVVLGLLAAAAGTVAFGRRDLATA
jgi:ABC-2 type transport system permease protein